MFLLKRGLSCSNLRHAVALRYAKITMYTSITYDAANKCTTKLTVRVLRDHNHIQTPLRVAKTILQVTARHSALTAGTMEKPNLILVSVFGSFLGLVSR